MATLTYTLVVFVLTVVDLSLGFNESAIDRTPNYFLSSHGYQPPLSAYAEDLDKRLFLNGLFSTPAPIRDIVNQLILNQLVRVPGVKESTNAGDVCQLSSGEYGTCLTRATCSRNGGQSGASCGFGTFCCTGMSLSSCGGQISLNNTYWNSPRSLDGVTECSATLKLNSNLFRQGDSICQVRLDFENFNLAQPTSSTKCGSSLFNVFGTSNNVPGICGRNSQQHMYLHTTSNEIKLNFKLDGSKKTPTWRIRVSLIPCWSSYLAPSDCLQYYTGPSGSLTSFYSQSVPLSRSVSPARTSEIEIPLEGEGLGDYLRRAFETELATDAPVTDPTPSTTTTTTTVKPTTQAPFKGDGYVYRKIKLDDTDVKICFKKD